MRKMLMLFCCSLLLFISGCETADMFTSSNIEAPVCPGIYITDEDSNNLGMWMEPYSPSYEFPNSNPNLFPITMKCSAYPNPNNGGMVIRFPIPYQSNAEVTAYSILSPFADHKNSVNYNGNSYLYVNSDPVRTLYDGELNEGSHSIYWDGCDENGNYPEDGFYRVYLSFDTYLAWVDVCMVRDLNNLPPGMGWHNPEW